MRDVLQFLLIDHTGITAAVWLALGLISKEGSNFFEAWLCLSVLGLILVGVVLCI